MKHDQPSKSLLNFRRELEGVLNTILASSRYEYTFIFLKEKKKELNVPDEIFDEFITPLEKFEGRNFTYNYLFISVITILETYLKDRLIEELNTFPEKRKKLLKDYKIERKLGVEDVLAGVDPLVNEILGKVVFHKFSKVNILYDIVFDEIKILEFIPKNLWQYVKIRHDLVHRSGNRGDKKILVSEWRLIDVMSDVSQWVENIDYFYRKGTLKKRHISFISKYGKSSKNYPHYEFFRNLMNQNFSNKMPEIGTNPNDEYLHL